MAALSVPAHGQVRGTVIDAGGQPVAGASIEFWNAGGRITSTIANDAGVFVGPDSIRPPVAILVRRIGFLPTRLQLTSTDPVFVALRSRQTLVEGVSISADRLRCVLRDNARGRAHWLAMRDLYGPRPLTVRGLDGRAGWHLWGDARAAGAFVPPESLGTLDTSRLQAGMIAGGSTGMRMREQSASAFYTPSNRGFAGGRHDRYSYPYLDSFDAGHFADSMFGVWNAFGEPVVDGSVTMIEFCSRRGRNESFITGMLYFDSDTTLQRAQWTFVTSDERAGGEVTFAPRSKEERWPPLAAIGLAWRRRLRDVYQEWWVYERWSICDQGCTTRRKIG